MDGKGRASKARKVRFQILKEQKNSKESTLETEENSTINHSKNLLSQSISMSDIKKKPKDLANRFSFLENLYVDKFLKGDLNSIYKSVQLKCGDFRNKVFDINLMQLDNEMTTKVNKRRSTVDHKAMKEYYENKIQNPTPYPQLEKEFAERANKYIRTNYDN